MRNLVKVAAAAAALFALSQASAQAQATRTWVSGVGDDANPCSRTAPCKTFPGAISKTAMNGEINCLDPGGFGTVTITKSITIDCHEVFASILASGTNGININITNASDPLKTVRIRNINIDGTGTSGTVGTRTGLKGINIIAANAVFVEDTMIRNFTQQGISDSRTAGGTLFVNNTTVQDNTGAGILIAPSSGSVRIDASVSHAILERNADGIHAGPGARIMVKRSILSGNTNGAVVEASAGASRMSIDDSSISNNTTGVRRLAGGAIWLSNNDISYNTTAKIGPGNLLSFGNNRLTENGSDGDPFTADTQQ